MKRTAKIIPLFKLAEVVEMNPLKDEPTSWLRDRMLDMKTPDVFKQAIYQELKRRRVQLPEIGHRA